VVSLDLSEFELENEHTASLARGMEAGVFLRLEELSLDCNYDDNLVTPVTSALAKGACPQLRRLEVDTGEDDAGEAIAMALESGHCQRLEHLGFVGDVAVPVFRALANGCCPLIRSIGSMLDGDMGAGCWSALAAAVRSGNMKHLETLNLYDCEESLAVAAVLDALSSGGCPSLQELTIEKNKGPTMNRQADVALVKAVEFGYLRHATKLHLHGMFRSGHGTHFFEAIKHGGLPTLQELRLRDTNILGSRQPTGGSWGKQSD